MTRDQGGLVRDQVPLVPTTFWKGSPGSRDLDTLCAGPAGPPSRVRRFGVTGRHMCAACRPRSDARATRGSILRGAAGLWRAQASHPRPARRPHTHTSAFECRPESQQRPAICGSIERVPRGAAFQQGAGCQLLAEAAVAAAQSRGRRAGNVRRRVFMCLLLFVHVWQCRGPARLACVTY